MENADLTRLMQNARIHVPGAVDSALQLELFNVLTDFFQRSSIWQEDVVLAVTPDRQTYDVTPSDPGQIVRLMSVTDATGRAVPAAMPIPGTITLRHPPAGATAYTVTLVLTVVDPVKADGYPRFPIWVMTKYGAALTDGLVGKMMAQAKKPYSNSQLAIFHLKKFQSAVSQARTDSRHQNLYAAQRWGFPQTFATGRK